MAISVLIRRPGKNWPFMFFLSILATVWCSSQFFWVAASTLSEALIVTKIQYPAITIVPPVWYLFALFESRRSTRFSLWHALFFIIPAICLYYVYSYAPGQNNYLWQAVLVPPAVPIAKTLYGPLFWIMLIYSYILILGGCLILYAHYTQSPYYRSHLYATVAMPIIVLAFNYIYVNGYWPLPVDPTPLSFSMGFALLAWAMHRRQFMEISPLTRSLALDSIDEGVFILDSNNRIVDTNSVAAEITGMPTKYIMGKEINSLFATIAPLKPGQTQQLSLPDDRLMEIKVSEITQKNTIDHGHILIFRDITNNAITHKLLLETQQALQEANRELDTMAHTDDLTGLSNRRLLLLKLEEEIARSQRHQQPLALLFIDIDHFKQVNDLFGHKVGDEVLQRIGKTLQRHRKGSDIAARYGGEELVLILTSTNQKEAIATAKRFWRELQETHHHASDNNMFQVTASIGIAMLSSANSTPFDLIERADHALYHAKKQGRNSISLAKDDGYEDVSYHDSQTTTQ